MPRGSKLAVIPGIQIWSDQSLDAYANAIRETVGPLGVSTKVLRLGGISMSSACPFADPEQGQDSKFKELARRAGAFSHVIILNSVDDRQHSGSVLWRGVDGVVASVVDRLDHGITVFLMRLPMEIRGSQPVDEAWQTRLAALSRARPLRGNFEELANHFR